MFISRRNQTKPGGSLSAGFTLIELLIALSLGLVLVAGVAVVFIQNSRSALQDEELSRVLENGRFVMRLMSRELAMSGFWGKFMDIGTLVDHPSTLSMGQDCGDGSEWVTEPDAMELLNGATAATVAATFECLPSSDVVEGSDVIALKRTVDAETDDASIVTNQLYLRTNGVEGELFIGGASATPPALSGVETNWEFLPSVYYVRDYSISDGDDIPTLCRAYLDRSANPAMVNECLVEGIENLQIEIGVDNDNDYVADYYRADPTAAEISEAVSARIWVLARSINELPAYTNDKTYNLGAVQVAAANDRYFRRVFSSTVVLRNRANLTAL